MGWLNRIVRADGTSSTPENPISPTAPERRRRPAPERLTKLNFDRWVRDHPRAVIDVWASWCTPCRAFSPIFTEVAGEWGELVGFGKVQAEHEPSLITRFGVRSIPSLLFFRDGRLVRTEVGIIPQNHLTRLLRKTFRDLPSSAGAAA